MPNANTNTSSNLLTNPMPPVEATQLKAAFERRLPEILAVPAEDAVSMNLDVNVAVCIILGSLPEITAHRGAIAGIAGVDQAAVDALEDYALATQEAHTRATTAGVPATDLVALNEEALRLREALRLDVAALANRKLVDPSRLAPIRGLVGYRNVASELISYATIVIDCWPSLAGRAPMTYDELVHAKEVGTRLLYAAGLREQAQTGAAEAVLLRNRALKLLTHAYSEVRRAITFLRWYEGDTDQIAPSLYTGRGGRGRASEAASEEEEGSNEAGDTPVASANSANPFAANNIPPGFPGASPFIG
jgi:hypothetical protein